MQHRKPAYTTLPSQGVSSFEQKSRYRRTSASGVDNEFGIDANRVSRQMLEKPIDAHRFPEFVGEGSIRTEIKPRRSGDLTIYQRNQQCRRVVTRISDDFLAVIGGARTFPHFLNIDLITEPKNRILFQIRRLVMDSNVVTITFSFDWVAQSTVSDSRGVRQICQRAVGRHTKTQKRERRPQAFKTFRPPTINAALNCWAWRMRKGMIR